MCFPRTGKQLQGKVTYLRPFPICDLPLYREIGGGQRSKSLAKKIGISVLSDLTRFRPPMFPVGGTRRWKKKNAIFLRETLTFTGNVIVSRGF